MSLLSLSINDNIKFLEHLTEGFRMTVSWNKYRSEITTQPKNSNLIIWLIERLRTLIGCLSFHSKMVKRILQGYLLMSILSLIKDFNAQINNKLFFDQLVETNKKSWKTCRNFKKQWIYNRKPIRLPLSSKLL